MTTQKKKKSLLFLPLVALPFLAMAFWALGGGTVKAENTPEPSQLITDLPAPDLKEKPMSKMSLYEVAEKDSIRKSEAEKQDPYSSFLSRSEPSLPEMAEEDAFTNPYARESLMGLTDPSTTGSVEVQERQVQQKLSELQKALETSDPIPQTPLPETTTPDQFAQMETYMQRLGDPDREDPELTQIDRMLEKILDIQNPERAREKLQKQSLENRGKVYPVHLTPQQTPVELIKQRLQAPENIPLQTDSLSDSTGVSSWTIDIPETNGFYGLEEEVSTFEENRLAVPAVIHQEQELVAGATVKMRLTRDIFIDGEQIPKGTFVFGACRISGERLEIDVKAIRHGEAIFPVNLSVYDMDALEGIRIPGAITRQSAKEGADNAVSNLQLMPYDASIGTQMASAGIDAAKGLFGKKVKLIKVTVKTGYPVLLVDKNQNNQ